MKKQSQINNRADITDRDDPNCDIEGKAIVLINPSNKLMSRRGSRALGKRKYNGNVWWKYEKVLVIRKKVGGMFKVTDKLRHGSQMW